MTEDVETAMVEPARLVELLGDPHRAFAARTRLIALGSRAQPAVIVGLEHAEPRVRAQCCAVLDHIADVDGLRAVEGALDDPVADVRMQAIHTLACDRCKNDECRPEAARVLPRAIAMLSHDEDAHVRAHAVELVGAWVHTHPAAADALVEAAAGDSSPSVRKKASWYAPSGSVWQRTQPRTASTAGAR